jgi:hypothetical protein
VPRTDYSRTANAHLKIEHSNRARQIALPKQMSSAKHIGPGALIDTDASLLQFKQRHYPSGERIPARFSYKPRNGLLSRRSENPDQSDVCGAAMPCCAEPTRCPYLAHSGVEDT